MPIRLRRTRLPVDNSVDNYFQYFFTLRLVLAISTDIVLLMTHQHYQLDRNGDIVDINIFCSDFCHESWCKQTDSEYDGWNGCHETEHDVVCEYCDTIVKGYAETEVYA